jgi:hypothetical protein
VGEERGDWEIIHESEASWYNYLTLDDEEVL